MERESGGIAGKIIAAVFLLVSAAFVGLLVYTKLVPAVIVAVIGEMVNMSGEHHTPLFSSGDEAMASLPWRLYLGNTDTSFVKTDAAFDHIQSEPTVTTPMRPWEARVYLLTD